MPEYKKFACDGLPINNETLTWVCSSGNKIMLIKFYKYITGLSLRECKDAIERNCCEKNETGVDYSPVLDIDKTIRLFSNFIGPFPSEDEVRVQRLQAIDLEETRKIEQAIACATSNWKTLCFKSKIDACYAVLRNIARNPQD